MGPASQYMDEVIQLLFLLYVRETSHPIYRVRGHKDGGTSLGDPIRDAIGRHGDSQVPLTDTHHRSIMATFLLISDKMVKQEVSTSW